MKPPFRISSGLTPKKAGQVQIHTLDDLPRLADLVQQRPKEQWWLEVRPIAKVLAQPAPRKPV